MCQGQCLRPQRCLYRILCEQLSQDIPAGYKTKMKGPRMRRALSCAVAPSGIDPLTSRFSVVRSTN